MPEDITKTEPEPSAAEELDVNELGIETESNRATTGAPNTDPAAGGQSTVDPSNSTTPQGAAVDPAPEVADADAPEAAAAATAADNSSTPADAPTSFVSFGSANAKKMALKQTDKRVIVLIVLLVLLILGWAATAVYKIVLHKDVGVNQQAAPANSQATAKKLGLAVGLLEGTVEYSTDKGITWQPYANTTTLAEGNQVRTSADGRAVLLLDDGSAMRLAPTSSLELTSLDATSVVVTQLSGELYSRVVASDTRKYSVNDNGVTYVAKGTAFRTSNTAVKKGGEVFQSTVGVDGKAADVTEGNAYFSLCDQKEKQDVVSAIDLTALKKDDFIKWNSEQDKKESEYADKLGVLAELDKPDPTPPAVTTTPTPTQKSSNGITFKGSVSEYSAVFSWKVAGVDTSKGFKLVKSSSNKNPTYPENYAAYIESGKTSYNLYLGDSKTYYFRLCAYRGDSCDSYSNTVTITTPTKAESPKGDGAITLSLNGSLASWSYTGSEPYGYKLVVNTTGSPTYPESTWKYVTEATSSTLPDGLVPGTKYFVRVCKYYGSCSVYSNELTYTAP